MGTDHYTIGMTYVERWESYKLCMRCATAIHPLLLLHCRLLRLLPHSYKNTEQYCHATKHTEGLHFFFEKNSFLHCALNED